MSPRSTTPTAAGGIGGVPNGSSSLLAAGAARPKLPPGPSPLNKNSTGDSVSTAMNSSGKVQLDDGIKPSGARSVPNSAAATTGKQRFFGTHSRKTSEAAVSLKEGTPNNTAPSGYYGFDSISNTPIGSPIPGSSTPPARRSVQFARPGLNTLQPDSSSGAVGGRTDTDDWELNEDGETPKSASRSTFLSKLKALAAVGALSPHGRSQSGWTVGGASVGEDTPDAVFSPESERDGMELRYDAEGSDADTEGSSAEDNEEAAIRRRRMRRMNTDIDIRRTAPSTPAAHITGRTSSSSRVPFSNSPMADSPSSPGGGPIVLPLKRRATMTDIPEATRSSDDGGHRRISRTPKWATSAWPFGSQLNGSDREKDKSPVPGDLKRESTFRRIPGFGHAGDREGSPSPSGWHLASLSGLGERSQSVSAARWKQLKAGLKFIGPKKKEENKADHKKSAELMAELTAGVPAAIMLASMFQLDEHGRRRIPVLLEQLKVKITDSKALEEKSDSIRHNVMRIELEYGSGVTRMSWVVNREIRDFVTLHSRYKLADARNPFRKDKDGLKKLPHFPRSAVPYLRGVPRTAKDSSSEGENEPDLILDDETGPSAGEISGPDGPAVGPGGRKKKKRTVSMSFRRRLSIGFESNPENPASPGAGSAVVTPAAGHIKKDTFAERQRKKLELYLQQLIQIMIFRPDSNRLCKFLELSALGIRLGAEGSYHGKEGYLMIRSAKGLDFRSGLAPRLVLGRHSPKWFLIRHSYIVCVDSPEEMNIYDVFLVDADFSMDAKGQPLRVANAKQIAQSAKDSAAHPQYHTLKVTNSERRIKLLAKNERQLYQFRDSIQHVINTSPWAKVSRFDSFAPVRYDCQAQWLVDGRDHMWNVSKAINMAKDVIYIHDWWLSPELYLRRPAAISQKWRLDRLLQRKAKEGVKVFVIVYRNVGNTIPIDSAYTKYSLLDLHPNIFVQRSPNQFRQQTFFWAHHEKICVVDHSIAFVGGIDLCFGRWDTPQHTLCDDKPTGFEETFKDVNNSQLWPGKDYSNPRVSDFFTLDKPYDDMYDRQAIARMPWHDISMQVTGQPARDLTRHFVQRWNYILRQRKPTRPTPFLLPPPDFTAADLESLGLKGTCEVQILRSASPWSMGFRDKVEHSIMNAYVKSIEQSEHFVYIENQFFISTGTVEGVKIENSIGDALVDRIIRAYKEDQDWRAFILIPLVPGFESTVGVQDGTSVRLIMQCQYRTICRGEGSIFGRLRALGIEPEEYIQFYSLRSWGKIGPLKRLVSEQVYIHAKCMIVDDRIAIIGSANINERSMLGGRDSEAAAIVRDKDMLWSTMAGQPYLVGKFPHTLRMRLMREHIGIDVDEIMSEERREEAEKEIAEAQKMAAEEAAEKANGIPPKKDHESEEPHPPASADGLYSFNHDIDWEQGSNPNILNPKKKTKDKRVMDNLKHAKDVAGEGKDLFAKVKNSMVNHTRETEIIATATEALVVKAHADHVKPIHINGKTHKDLNAEVADASDDEGNASLPPSVVQPRDTNLPLLSQLPPLPVLNDADIGGPTNIGASVLSRNQNGILNLVSSDMQFPQVSKDCMRDPLNESAFHDTWHRIAENNTRLYRHVFRCMPDNEVKSWPEYKEYEKYAQRFSEAQGAPRKDSTSQHPKSGPPGAGLIQEKLGPIADQLNQMKELPGQIGEMVMEKVDNLAEKTNANTVDEKKDAEETKEKDADTKKEAEAEAKAEGGELNEKQGLGNGDLQESNMTNHVSAHDYSPVANSAQSDATTTVTSNLNRTMTPLTKAASKGSTAPTVTLTSSQSISRKHRRRTMTRGSKFIFNGSDPLPDMADAEELLQLTQGDLVIWPYDWLENEEHGSHWLWPIDRLAPLEI
jgi:phospholipase D1/2